MLTSTYYDHHRDALLAPWNALGPSATLEANILSRLGRGRLELKYMISNTPRELTDHEMSIKNGRRVQDPA